MSDNDTIFEDKPTTEDPGSHESEILSQITNEDGTQKYADVETALKSIQHAQTHIETLEAELADIRAKQDAAPSVEELLEAARQEQPVTPARVEPDADQIATTVEQAVEKIQLRDKAKANQKSVVTSLTEKFGDKARDIYLQKAQELGLTPKAIDSLAGSSPAAVLSWFDTEKKPVKHSESTVRAPETPTEPQKPSSIMGSGTTDELVSAWRASAPTEE